MATSRFALRALVLALPALGFGPVGKAQGGADRPVALTGLDLYMPRSVGNAGAMAVTLGRRLFFDPSLSRDSSIACASCHRPEHGFADGRRVAVGIGGRAGRRNAPTIVNRGYGTAFSWDGRNRDLEAQVLQALRDPLEMDVHPDQVAGRLAGHPEYARDFRDALGAEPSVEALALAVAEYVRSVRAGDSPFDRFAAGDSSALAPLELAGLRLFQGRARCDRCHSGALLSDEQFHNTGVAWLDGALSDSGRFSVTGRAADRGAFKTPTLREVAATAPYMHDGSLATLEQVVDFYDRGGNPNPHLDQRIRPLRLSAAEREALLAFLRALSGTIREGSP